MFLQLFYFLETMVICKRQIFPLVSPIMRVLIYLLLPLSLLLAGCGSTPEKRIQSNPELFNKLTTDEQNLVRAGKISRGMSKPAVFLAMGNPDRKTSGVQHGKSFERWHYNIMVPVYSHDVYPYYRGYGRDGCHSRYYGLGYQPVVHYVPRHGASVEFIKDEVVGWSSTKR